MSLPLPSTFMPLPLAIMIPFMGMQSMVMAKQFGEGFQYGKRRISAMSNEEFNKLSMGTLMQQTNDELKTLIPNMKESLQQMRPFQREIFIEMLAALKEAIGLGIDVGKAALGVDTNLPSIPTDKFRPGPEEEERGFIPPPEHPPTKITEPRFQRVSSQTLKIERNKLIRDIAKQGNILKKIPRTIIRKIRTTATRGGSGGRVVCKNKVVQNPKWISENNKLKSLQSKLISIIRKLRTR